MHTIPPPDLRTAKLNLKFGQILIFRFLLHECFSKGSIEIEDNLKSEENMFLLVSPTLMSSQSVQFGKDFNPGLSSDPTPPIAMHCILMHVLNQIGSARSKTDMISNFVEGFQMFYLFDREAFTKQC